MMPKRKKENQEMLKKIAKETGDEVLIPLYRMLFDELSIAKQDIYIRLAKSVLKESTGKDWTKIKK